MSQMFERNATKSNSENHQNGGLFLRVPPVGAFSSWKLKDTVAILGSKKNTTKPPLYFKDPGYVALLRADALPPFPQFGEMVSAHIDLVLLPPWSEPTVCCFTYLGWGLTLAGWRIVMKAFLGFHSKLHDTRW